jgi:hypothetical protein
MYSPSLYIMLAHAHAQELRLATQTAEYRRAAVRPNKPIRSTTARRVTQRAWTPDGVSRPPAYATAECCVDCSPG